MALYIFNGEKTVPIMLKFDPILLKDKTNFCRLSVLSILKKLIDEVGIDGVQVRSAISRCLLQSHSHGSPRPNSKRISFQFFQVHCISSTIKTPYAHRFVDNIRSLSGHIQLLDSPGEVRLRAVDLRLTHPSYLFIVCLFKLLIEKPQACFMTG